MSESAESYRRILLSSSLIGGASFTVILLAIFRTKVLAVLLGPEGIGLAGLYLGLISTAAAIATMGIGSSGTRQVADAAAKADSHAIAVARRALSWGAVALAIGGTFAVWVLREPLAILVLGSAQQSKIVGWLSLAVGFSVVGVSQGALLQGMRRISELAALNVTSAAVSMVVGLAFIWQWGEPGLVAYVLAGPGVGYLLGHIYSRPLPGNGRSAVRTKEIVHEWKKLIRSGIAFMGAGLVASLVQLWMRVVIGDELGVAAVGHFQAAWTISSQYLGFVLGAMAMDYYPRLAGLFRDAAAASRLVSHQTEAALLLAGPVFVAMMTLAPWIVQLLFAPAFAPAASVLRWQILGDILKVASWPLGFVLLAAGDGRMFFWTEAAAFGVMGAIVACFTATLGLQVAGIASLVAYLVYLPLVYVLARRRIGFQWSRTTTRLFAAIFVCCGGLAFLGQQTLWGTAIGCVASTLFALYGFARLSRMTEISGRVGKIASAMDRLMARIGIAHGPGRGR